MHAAGAYSQGDPQDPSNPSQKMIFFRLNTKVTFPFM